MAKRKQSGVATSDLIPSARVGDNATRFAEIAKLHLKPGSKVADVTYGKGVFWKRIEPTTYDLYASDIGQVPMSKHTSRRGCLDGVDCRKLPYGNASFDCIVLDPPYIEGFFRRAAKQLAGSGSHSRFRKAYSSAPLVRKRGNAKYHEAVVDLYVKAGLEARRVLRRGGLLIVKCQDEVSANKQRLTHIEIVTAYEDMGFYCKDVFVLVRTNAPGVSRIIRQVHARKNHSYFLVFELPKGKAKMPSSVRTRTGALELRGGR